MIVTILIPWKKLNAITSSCLSLQATIPRKTTQKPCSYEIEKSIGRNSLDPDLCQSMIFSVTKLLQFVQVFYKMLPKIPTLPIPIMNRRRYRKIPLHQQKCLVVSFFSTVIRCGCWYIWKDVSNKIFSFSVWQF